jgi:hypothetical protein
VSYLNVVEIVWNICSSVFWVERRVFQAIPEVSEKHIASIFRDEVLTKQEASKKKYAE